MSRIENLLIQLIKQQKYLVKKINLIYNKLKGHLSDIEENLLLEMEQLEKGCAYYPLNEVVEEPFMEHSSLSGSIMEESEDLLVEGEKLLAEDAITGGSSSRSGSFVEDDSTEISVDDKSPGECEESTISDEPMVENSPADGESTVGESAVGGKMMISEELLGGEESLGGEDSVVGEEPTVGDKSVIEESEGESTIPMEEYAEERKEYTEERESGGDEIAVNKEINSLPMCNMQTIRSMRGKRWTKSNSIGKILNAKEIDPYDIEKHQMMLDEIKQYREALQKNNLV